MTITTGLQEIILNDSSVAELSELSIKTIKSIGEHFKCLPRVYIFETIHGHIAYFAMEDERVNNWDKEPKEEWCKSTLALSMEDLEFLGDLSNLRCIKLINAEISFHFSN
ncbi:MAG: hypothetical protein QM504_10295 [Pseudomonadota bacterium]